MFVYNGKEIETDAQGYLLDHTQWEEGMIELLAEEEGIELTEAHLEVVHFVRDFYEEFNTSPAVRMLVKAMEKAHGPEKGNSKYLFKLFKKALQSRQPNWLDSRNQRNAFNHKILKPRYGLYEAFSCDTLSTVAVRGPSFNHSVNSSICVSVPQATTSTSPLFRFLA